MNPIDIGAFKYISTCVSFFQTENNVVDIGFIAENNQSILNFHLSVLKNKGILRYNGLMYDISNVTTPVWQTFCFIVDKEQSLLNAWINHKMVLVNKSTENLKQITKLRALFQCPKRARFTMFNVHNEESRNLTLGCGKMGNIYSWNASDWARDPGPHSQIIQELQDEVCLNKISFMHPLVRTYHGSVNFCSKLKGKLPSFNKLTEFNTTWLYYKKKNVLATDFITIPWIKDRNDNNNISLKYMYDNSTLSFTSKFPWAAGQPNGKDFQNTIACNSQGCYDFNEFDENNFLCELQRFKKFRLRGLCSKTVFDTDYTPTSSYANFTWIGSDSSHIKNNDSWYINVYGSNAYAVSYADLVNLLIGTTKWKVFKDKRCSDEEMYEINLSLNACSDEEFNCQNGDCIDIQLRCDGRPDCKDGTDERDCHILNTDSAYNKDVKDTDETSKMNIHFYLINILDVNEKDGTIRIQFRLVIEWTDSRLCFNNLKEKYFLNKLTEPETSKIWKPSIVLHDTDLLNRNVHEEEIVYIKRGGQPKTAEISMLYNALVYSGKENILSLQTSLR